MARNYPDLTDDEVLDLRDSFADKAELAIRGLVDKFVSGAMKLQELLAALWKMIRSSHIAQFLFGLGGKDKLTPALTGEIESIVGQQLGYFQKFWKALVGGSLSGDQMVARAGLYGSATVQTFERGNAASAGLTLPYYPGEGSPCQMRCRCAWEIEEFDDRWEANWQSMRDDAVCDVCQERDDTNNPLVVKK